MNFFKQYYEICGALFYPLGFVKKGKSFYRAIGDVVQNFVIEKISSGREVRITFAVLPLCLKLEERDILGGSYCYELRRFEPSGSGNPDAWPCDSTSPKARQSTLAEIERFLKMYLVPLFSRATSSQAAFSELAPLKEKFKKINPPKCIMKRYPTEQRLGDDDPSLFFMALKSGYYSDALLYRQALLMQNRLSYESMMETGYLSAENRKKREERISTLQREVDMLAHGKFSSFEMVIAENEEYSRAALKEMGYNM